MGIDPVRFLAPGMRVRGCKGKGGRLLCQYWGLALDERYGSIAYEGAVAACTVLGFQQIVKNYSVHVLFDELANHYSVDHVLVMFELQSNVDPWLPRRRSPYEYVHRLPCSNSNIRPPSRSAHVAILVPIHAFFHLIMNDSLSICVQ